MNTANLNLVKLFIAECLSLANREMTRLYFLPYGMREKTDGQVWSLDRGGTAHKCCEAKQ